MVWVGQVYFYVCAAIAVLAALATVASRNPIRGAMGLLLMIVAVAGLFLGLDAQFLAAVQLIVYAGAVVVLFLFVIMMLGPSAVPPRDRRGVVGRTIGGLLFASTVLAGLVLLAGRLRFVPSRDLDTGFGSVSAFGHALFSDALVPFELSSALLLVAILGALAVARGRQGEAAPVLPSGQPGLAAPSATPAPLSGASTTGQGGSRA
jgi:NADH-quinone oxidoreductase subunit J